MLFRMLLELLKKQDLKELNIDFINSEFYSSINILPCEINIKHWIFTKRSINYSFQFQLWFSHFWSCFFIVIIQYFHYYNLLKRGVRIATRPKINDSSITGTRIVDSILPIGRGQRQLILGDRYSGKTSIYLSLLLYCNYLTLLGSLEGFGFITGLIVG